MCRQSPEPGACHGECRPLLQRDGGHVPRGQQMYDCVGFSSLGSQRGQPGRGGWPTEVGSVDYGQRRVARWKEGDVG